MYTTVEYETNAADELHRKELDTGKQGKGQAEEPTEDAAHGELGQEEQTTALCISLSFDVVVHLDLLFF